jgi:hypothetical protein
MNRVCAWGFQDECSKVIEMLRECSEIDLVEWVGLGAECKINSHALFDGNFKDYPCEDADEELYETVYKHIATFFNMYGRKHKEETSYNSRNVYDYIDLFNRYFNLFRHLLVSRKIDLVVFANFPHEGPDMILYLLAKSLGLETILFYQSIFPNKSFVVRNLDDFGLFEEIPNLCEPRECSIERTHKKELFYMNSVTEFQYPSRRVHRKLRITPRRLLGLMFRKYTEEVFSPELGHAITKYHKSKTYLEDMASICESAIDSEKKYVYFPLHLQPELTTSLLGGKYCDQVLAIERLSNILPKDWFIYVKENPKQTEFMRGDWFFKRLRTISNIRVISPQINTYDLIKNCEFVATVTGTAGWEAITGGTKVLIFGNAWYRSMPGVFQYSEDIDIQHILDAVIDHSEVEKQLALLQAKMVDGIVNPYYVNDVEGFDADVNARSVVSVVMKLI